jgi:hypothetical protein
MADATTNLTDVAADRITLWNNEERSQQDIRTIFVNNEQVKKATRFEQRVGDEVDVVLVFEAPSNQEVPALKDLVEYIAQEKLGDGATVNKYYNVNRKNLSLIQEVETIARRGRLGPKGQRGARGAAGKAQIVVQEGDVYATTKSAPSIRGRQEMVLCQGDTHLSRITKHREVKQSTVNHTETQLLNVTKRSTKIRNEVLLFQEGDRTTIRNSTVNRRSTTMIDVFTPITAYRKPKQVVARTVIMDVFSPVILQRITNVTKINRSIFISSPG